MAGQHFKNRPGTGAAHRQIGHRIHVGEFFAQKWKRTIARNLFPYRLPRYMHHLRGFQQLRQNPFHQLIQRLRPGRSPHNQNHRTLRGKSRQRKTFFLLSAQNPAANGIAHDFHLLLGKVPPALLKRQPDFPSKPAAEAVCETRTHIGFMEPYRNGKRPRGKNHRHADVSALGKNEIGLEFFEQQERFKKSERRLTCIRKIFPVEVAAQLAGVNPVKGNAVFESDVCFGAAPAPDIPALDGRGFFKLADNGDVGENVSPRPAAGEKDAHKKG